MSEQYIYRERMTWAEVIALWVVILIVAIPWWIGLLWMLGVI